MTKNRANVLVSNYDSVKTAKKTKSKSKNKKKKSKNKADAMLMNSMNKSRLQGMNGG